MSTALEANYQHIICFQDVNKFNYGQILLSFIVSNGKYQTIAHRNQMSTNFLELYISHIIKVIYTNIG